ncbi:MAG: hypothetical protein BGP14_03115 [Sphingobacteriales bacterium 44-15]|nr:MAG: hypothetical protein BGP14_03115 [Sphingobacteriales bacterium 44-15]
MPRSEQDVQECDATRPNSSNAAGHTIKISTGTLHAGRCNTESKSNSEDAMKDRQRHSAASRRRIMKNAAGIRKRSYSSMRKCCDRQCCLETGQLIAEVCNSLLIIAELYKLHIIMAAAGIVHTAFTAMARSGSMIANPRELTHAVMHIDNNTA